MFKGIYGEHPEGGSWVTEMDSGMLERPDGSWRMPSDPDWPF